ncbi:hypothetical protein ACTNBP_15290 [Oliverpabstia intestinalis]|uniref:hypothetical protein n=1 Tax=Oliverpabstia intestinalis TaxID=2606633 RepID=UPI003F8B1ABD
MLNKVQKAAFDLIQSDARFIYTLVDMQNNAKNINSNYVMMSIEYSCAMKSHFRKSGNQMSGKWKSSHASLLA